jgi:hypothetical protein
LHPHEVNQVIATLLLQPGFVERTWSLGTVSGESKSSPGIPDRVRRALEPGRNLLVGISLLVQGTQLQAIQLLDLTGQVERSRLAIDRGNAPVQECGNPGAGQWVWRLWSIVAAEDGDFFAGPRAIAWLTHHAAFFSVHPSFFAAPIHAADSLLRHPLKSWRFSPFGA